MPEVECREYKFMADRKLLNRRSGLGVVEKDIHALVKELGLRSKGSFEIKGPGRWITFIDTKNDDIHRSGMILRRRIPEVRGNAEITLKAISADRFIAASADVRPGKWKKVEQKFEEDVGWPFQSRFSKSTTIKTAQANVLNEDTARFAEALRFFPGLATRLTRGSNLDRNMRLHTVNDRVVFETVLSGPKVRLGRVQASLALILWTKRSGGKPLLLEFSFRYATPSARLRSEIAQQAFDFYTSLGQASWSRPVIPSKTQFVYGKVE